MRRVLLIGKTGQLGGEIFKIAPSFGCEIIAPDSKEFNVIDPEGVQNKVKAISPDWVINTSAYNATTKAEEEVQAAFSLNFGAVRSMAKICQALGIKFVTYSTDYVFDGTKGVPYVEADCPNPLQVYGMSKLAGEYAALNYYPEGSYVIRTCGLYGGKIGSPVKGNVVLNFLKEAKNNEAIKVSSEQIASPTYAGDLAEASLKLIKINAPAGIYHLINEGHCSWYEFAKEVLRLAGINTKIIPVDRVGQSGGIRRPKFSVLANAKAKKLGIVLRPWQEGLKSYVEFLKEEKVI